MSTLGKIIKQERKANNLTQAELEANKFASELLLPDSTLSTYSEVTLEQIAVSKNLDIELVSLKFQ